MRNLKRVLSLTLASVMLLGMMVVGASALDYSDVDNKYNIEAIEVLGVLGIMEGDENADTFRPEDPVTRAEMAKIMAEMLGLEYKHYEGTHPYTDMVGHWAEAYVAACSANGVINGRGGGIFDPNATVTTVEASAMAMRALGYFKYASDVAEGFEVATVSQGTKIGIYAGIEGSAYAPMTRNDVAQLALNTLQSSMVEAKTGVTVTTPDGTTINTGAATYEVREVTGGGTVNSKYGKIYGENSLGKYTIELGEQVYDGKLELRNAENVFGMPSRQWVYNNKAIGTYAKEADLFYSKAVTGKTIWNDLGRPTISGNVYYAIDNDVDVTDPSRALSGKYVIGNAGTEDVPGTGKGVETYVYINEHNNVSIYSINTYLAKVTSDYDAGDDSLTIEVLATPANEAGSFESELDGADFAISGYKQDDYVLVTAAFDGDSTYAIQSIAPAPVVKGVTVTQYRSGSNVTAGGKNRDYHYGIKDDEAVLGHDQITNGYKTNGTEYDVYLDYYDYVIGVEPTSRETTLDDFLFVVAAGTKGVRTEAEVIFMDGTKAVIDVVKTAASEDGDAERISGNSFSGYQKGTNSDAGDLALHHFYSFSVNKKGEYTLYNTSDARQGWAVGSDGDVGKATISPKKVDDITRPITTNGTDSDTAIKPANAKTVFIAGEKLYIGVEETPTVTASTKSEGIYYLYDDDTEPLYLAAVVTERKGSTNANASEFVYVWGGGGTKNKGYDGENDYYLYDAVVNGKIQKGANGLKAYNKSIGDAYLPGLYKIENYSDGYPELDHSSNDTYWRAKDASVTDLVYTFSGDSTAITYKNGTISFAGSSYYLSKDAKIYRMETDTDKDSIKSVSSPSQSSLGSLKKGTYEAYVVKASETDQKVVLLFLIRTGDLAD